MGLLEAFEALVEVKEATVNLFARTSEAQCIESKDEIEVWALKIKGKVFLLGYDGNTEILSARKSTEADRQKDALYLIEAHLKGREATK